MTLITIEREVLELAVAAFEQAQSCLRDETAEDISYEDAREDTISKVRESMFALGDLLASPPNGMGQPPIDSSSSSVALEGREAIAQKCELCGETDHMTSDHGIYYDTEAEPPKVLTSERFNKLIARLEDWRTEDHEDSKRLSRSDIIELLEGIASISAAHTSEKRWRIDKERLLKNAEADAILSSLPAGEPPFKFPYQRTFDAIGAAVTLHEGNSYGISVRKFQEAFNASGGAPPRAEAGDAVEAVLKPFYEWCDKNRGAFTDEASRQLVEPARRAHDFYLRSRPPVAQAETVEGAQRVIAHHIFSESDLWDLDDEGMDAAAGIIRALARDGLIIRPSEAHPHDMPEGSTAGVKL